MTNPRSVTKKPAPPTKPKPKNVLKNDSEKEPVRVFCRLRPLKNQADILSVRKLDDNLLELGTNTKQVYKFKHVFDEKANQHQVFETVAFPLIKELINGQNGLIFTYGVTSSGKTHTITGTPEDPGLLPRSLDIVFNTLNKNKLQAIRYVFKPDNQNGFDIIPTPDAILQQQKEIHSTNPLFKTGTPGSPRINRKRDLTSLEWENRIQEQKIVDEINCDNNYSVFVSYVEVYNNYIYDLLDDTFDLVNANGTCGARSKKIMEDNQKRYYVQNVKEVEVKSSNEAFDLCLRGMKRRRMAVTQLNSESSRSHSVFNIRLVQAPLDMEGVEILEDKKYIHVSQLSIVDLAGCERTSRTQATGNRLREASNINNSLMTLRNCFDVLRENQKFNTNKIVPYRGSKLTQMFKSYFEGDGNVEMVICINPGLEDLEETTQVCKFAELSQEITTNKAARIRTPFTGFSESLFASSINIGPPLPDKLLEEPDDENTLKEWLDVTEKQIVKKESADHFNKQNQLIIREQILELERAYAIAQQQNSVMKMDLEARECQIKDYENKFSCIQRQCEDLEAKSITQIQELQDELASVQSRLTASESDKRKLENDFINFKNSTKECWKQDFKRLQRHYLEKIREKELEMEKKLLNNQEKLDFVKKILNSEEELEFPRPEWMSPPSKKSTGEVDNRAPPVANPRYLSSINHGDDKWIDHRPAGTLDLGTVFQPNIKSRKRKSVTNVKASDLLSSGGAIPSKYALTHSQATNDGLVETRVFKGDVIPSATGGAQIIFKDVERLVQSRPEQLNAQITKARKRLADVWDRGTPSSSSSGSPGSSHE